ncbi:MAG: hypothetical protein IT440_13135 [Phycisphaeraceae bacterium]|nr:hypothetical protein [Phycisphaeraceae bacterium]
MHNELMAELQALQDYVDMLSASHRVLSAKIPRTRIREALVTHLEGEVLAVPTKVKKGK